MSSARCALGLSNMGSTCWQRDRTVSLRPRHASTEVFIDKYGKLLVTLLCVGRCWEKRTCAVLYCARPPHCDGAHWRSRGNDMTRTIRLVLAGAIIAASCSAATAQTMRMSGTIEKADGNVLSLKSSDGAEVKLTLTENVMIIGVVKASMADIKEGTFLGSAAMPQPD